MKLTLALLLAASFSTFASLAQASSSQGPVIQTALKVFYCVKAENGGDRDIELRLKVIRIQDGSILSDEVMGEYNPLNNAGLQYPRDCQRRATEMNGNVQ